MLYVSEIKDQTIMRFTKMHGAGNDYVYVNCFEEKIPADVAKLAIEVSDRHFGVGGDGLVLICPSEVADARMRMFNADGSESEMCGNAVRCVAKYLFDHGIARRDAANRDWPRRADSAMRCRRRPSWPSPRQHGTADSQEL